jgi:hypothetical protein
MAMYSTVNYFFYILPICVGSLFGFGIYTLFRLSNVQTMDTISFQKAVRNIAVSKNMNPR